MSGKDREPIMETEKKAVTDCNDPKELQDAKDLNAKENEEVDDNDASMVGGGQSCYAIHREEFKRIMADRQALEEKHRLRDQKDLEAARLATRLD